VTACFADTFYYLALLNPTDAAHKEAADLTAVLRRRIVTTTWVLTELGDGLAETPSRRIFAPFVARLESTDSMMIVRPTQDLFNRGLRFYDARPDKQWSLTDCISMVVMQESGIKDVLTGDHHFEQAGSNLLFK
jgi:predicted nucleic acid-binding protein